MTTCRYRCASVWGTSYTFGALFSVFVWLKCSLGVLAAHCQYWFVTKTQIRGIRVLNWGMLWPDVSPCMGGSCLGKANSVPVLYLHLDMHYREDAVCYSSRFPFSGSSESKLNPLIKMLNCLLKQWFLTLTLIQTFLTSSAYSHCFDHHEFCPEQSTNPLLYCLLWNKITFVSPLSEKPGSFKYLMVTQTVSLTLTFSIFSHVCHSLHAVHMALLMYWRCWICLWNYFQPRSQCCFDLLMGLCISLPTFLQVSGSYLFIFLMPVSSE